MLAVPFACLFVIRTKVISRAVAPPNTNRLSSNTGKFTHSILAVVLPTTIGLGTTEMSIVTEQAVEIGVLLLHVFALAKILPLAAYYFGL